MEEAIKLLREQTVLCRRSLELFAKLIELLKEKSPEITESVQKIEKFIPELRKNGITSQKFLQSKKCKTFADYINSQEKSIQRDVAERLLIQSENLQEKLRWQIGAAEKLTESGAAFVNFSLNLISQTSAGNTYGAEAVSDSQSKLRMIDANV